MSDLSETSSFNEEWEQMSDSSNISKNEVERMGEELEKVKMTLDKNDEESKKYREERDREVEMLRSEMEENSVKEVEKLKEEMKKKDEEIAMLRTKGTTFSMEVWMKIQMENMKLSSVNLSEKTLEVYKRIWEKEAAKAQAKTSSERKKLAEEIQEMEELCEEISQDVMKNNEEHMGKMTNLLRSEEKAESGTENIAEIKNLPIESFLGTYTTSENEAGPIVLVADERYACRAMIIGKEKAEGYFYISWICDNGKVISVSWMPDNVERDNNRVWIEGKTLFRRWGENTSRYELTDNGLFVCTCSHIKFSLVRV